MSQIGISRSLLANKSFVRSGLLAVCIFVLLICSQKLSKNNNDLTDSEHPYFNSAVSYMSKKGSQPLLQDRYRQAQYSFPCKGIPEISLADATIYLYSIIVSTFNRVEHVHQFLHTYANGDLPHLDAIFISWVRMLYKKIIAPCLISYLWTGFRRCRTSRVARLGHA